MIYEIDQSGKIENTNKLTIIAYANGTVKSLKISSVEKQKLVRVIRIVSYPKKTYVYKIFAALIFILLSQSKEASEVIIDKEYPGNEAMIKNFILQLFRKTKRQAPQIRFGNIGKKSKAHKAAIDVFRGERKADIMVESKEVLELFYK